MKVIYRGWIAEHSWGEADDILFLSSVEEPLAREIQDHMGVYGRMLAVRYFIANTAATIDELTEDLIRQVSGAGEARFGSRYSEVTGYLWTDEDIVVGGHDLLEELRGYVGKFCHLEIEYRDA